MRIVLMTNFMSLYLICLLLLLFLPKLNHLHVYKEASSRHRVELNNFILSVKQVLAHQRHLALPFAYHENLCQGEVMVIETWQAILLFVHKRRISLAHPLQGIAHVDNTILPYHRGIAAVSGCVRDLSAITRSA